MKKKNRSIFSTQGHGKIIKKTHELTAFELAYREAEAKKKTDNIKKIIPEERKPSLTLPSAFPKSQPSFDRAKTTIEKQNMTKSVPESERKKAPGRLNLKVIPKEDNISNFFDSISHDQKDRPLSDYKSEELSGRDQVYEDSYGDESDVVIGFDFGTSSSKIVIRDSGRQTAYAVPFGPLACSGNNYLVPTIIFINDQGFVSLSGGKHEFTDLKIYLMDNPGKEIFRATDQGYTITASELAASYLALVIRFARDWFLKNKGSIYKRTHIYWHLNLGIPSKNYDNHREKINFKTIAMAAWRISRLNKAVNISEVKEIFTDAQKFFTSKLHIADLNSHKSLWLHPDFVMIHPEVIMEVVGYARSPLRTEGLHLLVDVGANTLDTAAFIIHSLEGENNYPLLETNIQRNGTMVLHNRRIDTIKNSLQKTLRQMCVIDPIKPLPNLPYYETRVAEEDLVENDSKFFTDCSAIIGSVIRNTKNHRDPYSQTWKTFLPVFICGGGGRLLSYREMITDLGLKISKSITDFKGFKIKEIPKPDQLDAPDLPNQEYDRLAVAYGLSFTSDEIGEIIPESKISDIPKEDKILNVEDRFVSKDMC